MKNHESIRSRVFVSCGQKDEERQIASDIARRLTELGYEPYVAIYRQSTRGIIMNILEMLNKCEYYLFVDFKREQLIPRARENPIDYVQSESKPIEHRGSLFSNQELAVAIYLDKPLIAFQEKGIKTRDGMFGAIQGNAIEFANRDGLIDKVIGKVKSDWVSNWRNELIFTDKEDENIDPEYLDVYGPSGFPTRFFHISIENLHKDTSAHNCVAYLESYRLLERNGGETAISEPIELKWKGVKTQSVLIPPHTIRKFDAIYIYETLPHAPYVGINPFLVDYSGYSMILEGTGRFELNYVVYSDNFQVIRSTYMLEVEKELSKTRLYRKSSAPKDN